MTEQEGLLIALDELSFLSRETSGASFVIQHAKDSGKWYVSFNNAMMSSKEKLQPKAFDEAIQDAIKWIKEHRRAITIPEEKYTLYSRS